MSDVGRCDQDVLNGSLLSEIPREALVLLPEGEEVFGGDARVDDFETLACTSAGARRRPSLRRPPEAPRAIGLAVPYVLLAQLTQSRWD
jgi:hypothetical protein